MKIRRFWLGILILLLALWAVWSFYRSAAGAVDPTDTTKAKFTVKSGWTISEIANSLEGENLIRSSALFKWDAREFPASKFQSGIFVLQRSMDLQQVLESLTGSPQEMWITLLEGWRATEIADYLAEQGYADREEFLDCVQNCQLDYAVLSDQPVGQGLEGYLYPDTYIITPETKPLGIVNRMLKNLDEKFTPELRAQAAAAGRSLHEILTMASILEREVRDYEDKQLVAGLLWKRLEAGMGLDVDASVLYALGDWKAELNYTSLQTDSPYNTRKYAGLPPGPICSPGIESIKAAINPTPSDYWFYLTTLDTGKVIYGRTLEEHNQNVAKYLR